MATKGQRKRELKRQQREAEAAAKRAEERQKRLAKIVGYAIAAPVVTLIGIHFLGPLYSGQGSTSDVAKYYPKESIPPARPGIVLATAARAAGCTVITHPAEGHNHTTGAVHYKTNPPSSGDHNPIPSGDGVYTKAPSIEHLVHPLEHGRVILWFRPTAPAAVRGQLKALFDQSSDLLILTPNNTGMPYEVAASAWTGNKAHGGTIPEFGHVLGCPRMNATVLDALRAFIRDFRGKGAEHIPGPE